MTVISRSRPIRSALAERRIFLLRNPQSRRFALNVSGNPALAAFLERDHAEKMKGILESHYRLTGEWPDLTDGESSYMFMEPGPLDAPLLEIEEDVMDSFMAMCNRHYIKFIVVSSFATESDNRTKIRGTVLQREVDSDCKHYLETMLD